MKDFHKLFVFILCLLLGIGSVSALAQDVPKKDEAEQAKKDEGKQDEKKEKPKFKKYDEVITDKAVTKEGVFTTHMVEGKLYFEIPAEQLDKEFIWVTQFAQVQTGNGWGGMPITSNDVRWQRRGDEILLRLVDHTLRANPGTPEEIAVKASSLEAIVGVFKIVTFNEEKDKTPVIDVSDFFLGDVDEFSPKRQLNAQNLDKKRSFISSVKSFPTNIETEVMATYSRRQGPENQQQRRGFFGGANNDPTVTVLIHHSMVLLPEKQMLPRIFDRRVGFFGQDFEDYSKGVNGIEPIIYISRWRLEKKDPDAEISEPVKPIIWYVGRGVPEKWRKYVKEGIEMWQPAFEAAGFKNAIIAKEPPSVEEDPDWDAEDARYSVIRWLPTTIRNAFGPHIRDPRSGEIIEADVRIFHDVLELGRNWYFTKCGAADPNAQKLPLSDELMGQLLRYVVAHEVGHSLGLRHNHKSSSAYTVAQLRDAEYTKKYGYQASIMDYSRFNYVAQPGDGAVLAWDRDVGIYDKFAIEWGYRQFKGTKTPDEDIPFLNKIADRQLEDPRLLYGSYEEGEDGQADPFARSQDQTGEPVKATQMGMANLERIMGFLIPATTEKDKNFDLLAEIYRAVNTQMSYIMQNVAVLVGGIEYNKKVAGQPSAEVYKPISPAVQRDAVAYLLDNAFRVPAWLVNDEVTKRIGIADVAEAIKQTHVRLLGLLFDANRIKRMISLEATQPSAYSVSRLVQQLSNGIFSELKDRSPRIGVYRRNLQRAFVEILAGFVTGEHAVDNDLRAVARGTLLRLADDTKAAAKGAGDEITRFHLVDINQFIQKMLTGEVELEID